MIKCEWCPILAMCLAKETGSCTLIYEEIYLRKNHPEWGGSIAQPLSRYRTFLKKKVLWVKYNEFTVRFIK